MCAWCTSFRKNEYKNTTDLFELWYLVFSMIREIQRPYGYQSILLHRSNRPLTGNKPILSGRRLWQISYLPASLPLPPDYRNNFCQHIRSGTHQKDAWKYSLIWCYKHNPCRNQKINAKPFHFISNNPFLYRWRICVPFSRLSIVL